MWTAFLWFWMGKSATAASSEAILWYPKQVWPRLWCSLEIGSFYYSVRVWMNVISGSVVGGKLSFWRLRDGINAFFIMIIYQRVILNDVYMSINDSLRPIFTRCIFIRRLYLKIIYLGKNHLDKMKFSHRNEALRWFFLKKGVRKIYPKTWDKTPRETCKTPKNK